MAFQGDSIFWVDTEKVVPNPFQPRREFDQNKLQELSDSIRMYGVLQPLTVTRKEVQLENGTFYTEYELIAGERRLRASKLAQVAQVPVIIREGEQSEQEKLELAIIENLQREDLNAIDRALAFQQLAEQFDLSHTEVAKKVQRSREYVSNSIRLLALPEHIQGALQRGELAEGHARTLLMLSDRPEEQETIFREILLKKMSVREVERIVRKIATDKVRKQNKHDIDDHLIEIEKEFTETLGTRVQIQKTEFGGKLTIDYFSEDDLSVILERMKADAAGQFTSVAEQYSASAAVAAATGLGVVADQVAAPHDAPNSDSDQVAQPQFSSHTAHVPAQQEQPEPVVDAPEMTPAVETHTPQEAPAATQPATHTDPQPAADPSLLERLSAFTHFAQPEPVAAEPESSPQHTAHQADPVATPDLVDQVAPEAVAQQPAASQVSEAPAPETTEPSPATTSENQKQDDDLYSIRNFTV